jgi:hypothetical protein
VSYAPAVFNQNQNAVLPGDNTFTRQTTIAGGGLFAADAPLTPTAPNGIAPGEWLEVRFKLVAGYDFEDTIAAMTAAWTGPGNGQLRLGIHVQAFENGGSLSFIDNPIPLPSGGVMGMAGMGLLCFRRRRGV